MNEYLLIWLYMYDERTKLQTIFFNLIIFSDHFVLVCLLVNSGRRNLNQLEMY